MNLLRRTSGFLSTLGLFVCGVFLVFWPPSLPASLVGTLYFALSLFGVFALLPRLHCWLTAVASQLVAVYFLQLLNGHPDRAFYVGYICIHAAVWWLAIGYASFHRDEPIA